MSEARDRLRRGFEAGVAAVAPDRVVEAALAREPEAAGPVRLLAVGKAAGPMTDAFVAHAGARLVAGLVIVPADGPRPRPQPQIELRVASHPVPDERSAEAGLAALAFVAAGAEPLEVLLSGGASSLLSAPLASLSIDALARTTRLLQQGGADIVELNTVRKHMTRASGGRLAEAARGPVRVRAISDVAGDDPAVIGSAPFAPDPTGYADALAVLRRRAPGAPDEAWRLLEGGAKGERPESPGPGAAAFAHVRTEVLASNRDAVAAVLAHARREGAHAIALAEELTGEARRAGARLAARARGARPARRTWLVAGGETTVTVRGGGRGGRSQELALAAALALDGCVGIALLAAGSDGIDGPTPAAGAIVDGDSVARARRLGRDARAALEDNDAYGFFSQTGEALVTGATGTNVRDLAIVEIDP